jgi:class 3 adenylate cyclase/tetratricopeptide (TPR) repeat protein
MTACAHCGAELPEGARFCPACGASVQAAPPAAEERKLATVLFADLVGSTELGASQDPERTRAMLDRFYDAMAAEVEGAGGTVEKFAGDAVMAAFGAPAALEDHAERALHCALSMQHRLRELFGGDLSLRIGVTTGDVIVGRPREGSSFVTGDCVNVAARLEQAAAPGEILAGERTVAAARGAFEFGEPTTVEAKGKPGGVECRRLVRALSLMRPRGVSGLRRAFVGRESELGLLQATYRRVASERRPHVVTVMGDSGVGKTRLAREFWEWLGNEDSAPLRRTGRCLPYGDGITYWPLGEVLKEHLGLLESDPPETALRLLDARRMLGLTIGLDVAGDLHPLTARERLHEAWVEFLEDLAREQPVVVLVEDLHWGEDELFDLLERLARDVSGPLLLLGTARPELLDRRPDWAAGKRNASQLWLEALSAEQADRMVAELLSAELPQQIRDVVERAEGNPFFVEEVVATLIDRGVLAREDGSWTVGELADDLTLPDSVQAVLAARIDLLGPTEKAALQAASVIGRVFWIDPVRELLGGAEPDFDVLEERDFVRRRSGSSLAGEREYAIKHALTREVAYGSLPKARRARLHAAVGDWLERSGEGRDELAPLLAHHYAEAVRMEDADLAWGDEQEQLDRLRGNAIGWLRRAAELAVGRYEIDEALMLLHRALALEPSAELQSELWAEVGHANALRYDAEAFWAAMENALKLCIDPAVCAERYSELALQTVTRVGMWKRVPDEELIRGWIERALTMSEPGSRAHVQALLAKSSHYASAEAARDASAVAERLGDVELRALAWGARSVVAMANGDHEQALAWAQRRFDVLDQLRDPDLAAETYALTLVPAVALGRFREGRRLARAHDEVASRLTPHHRLHGVAILLEVETLAGGWETMVALKERTEQAVEANLDTPCVRNVLSELLLSAAYAYLGDEEESRRLEERAETIGYEEWELPNVPRLRVALARGDLDRVERLLAKVAHPEGETWFGLITRATRLDALAALRDVTGAEAEAPPFLTGPPYLEPFALRTLGVVRADESMMEQALARFEAMRLDWHAAETRKLLAAKS